MRRFISLVYVFLFFSVVITGHAYTGYCSGDECEGLNPHTMNCPSYVSKSFMTSEGGYVEVKSSGVSDCNSKWARLTNSSGQNKYMAASIRYGMANYDMSQNVRTSVLVGPNSVVYTPMTAQHIKPARGCGRVSSYGMISIPVAVVDIYCTSVSQN